MTNKKARVSPARKWLTYAHYTSLVFVLLFVGFVVLTSIKLGQDLSHLISNNLYITLGFILSSFNLYVWQKTKCLSKDLDQGENIPEIKGQLVFLSLGQLALFNYASLVLLLISLWKIWPLDKSIHFIKKRVLVTFLVTLMFVFLTYLIIFKALFR